MFKRALPLLMVCLVAATAAQAQSGGGGGHGRGGGGGGRGAPKTSAPPAAAQPGKPFSEPEIVGVIKTVDLDAGRLTIAYEPVEALSWPAGTQPFAVAKSALLKDLAAGQKVRFTLESQQIVAIRPF